MDISPAAAPEHLPQTGDGTSLAFWAALAAMSVIGMLIIRRKKEA